MKRYRLNAIQTAASGNLSLQIKADGYTKNARIQENALIDTLQDCGDLGFDLEDDELHMIKTTIAQDLLSDIRDKQNRIGKAISLIQELPYNQAQIIYDALRD